MILNISAKCSDMFVADLFDRKKRIGYSYDGCVPNWMPGTHYGDYVILSIDTDTGKILNWKFPTREEMEKTFTKSEE